MRVYRSIECKTMLSNILCLYKMYILILYTSLGIDKCSIVTAVRTEAFNINLSCSQLILKSETFSLT